MGHQKPDAVGVSGTAQTRTNSLGTAAEHSVPANGDGKGNSWSHSMASGELDAVLADLVDEYARRTFAGERVDIEELCARHPSRADELRGLLRSVGGLATLGREIEEDVRSIGEDGGELHRVFGDYRLILEIGRGGMGIVYEALQGSLERRVALKVLSLAAAVEDRARKRFQVEAHVAGLLEHPRVVPVYAVGTHEGVPFYAMRFIEGGSLADVIAELRRFDMPTTDRAGLAPMSEAPSLLA